MHYHFLYNDKLPEIKDPRTETLWAYLHSTCTFIAYLMYLEYTHCVDHSLFDRWCTAYVIIL